MDGEFDKDGLVGDVAELGISINCVAAEEHVPEIERHIRTIKERSRSVVGMLPFKQLPARIVIELIHYVVFWLNSFPVQRGISDVLSPRALVVGSTIDYATHCKIEFGAYVQTHEPHDNSMLPRTTGAIALRPTGNAQGGHYFYSLTTGKRLHRTQWTELPIPADVIDRVHKLSRRDLELTPLEFSDRAGVLIPDDDDDANDDDDDDDDDFDPNDDPANDDDDDDDWIDGQIAGVDDEIVEIVEENVEENAEDIPGVAIEEDANDEDIPDVAIEEAGEAGEEEANEVARNAHDEANEETNEDANEEANEVARDDEANEEANEEANDVANEVARDANEEANEVARDANEDANEVAREGEIAPVAPTIQVEAARPAMQVDELMDVRYGRRLGEI
ncbi:Reverse transcriptase (RNA-dependent DNA polymerase) [Fragilaria crotonensis]|nr:Reverse transcriptase (RNA-dependent DNA polymerase) [Fragilaria crotonensis]